MNKALLALRILILVIFLASEPIQQAASQDENSTGEKGDPGKITADDSGINESVQALYDEIEKLGPGSRVLIGFDFDLNHKEELYPIALGLFRHCFDKELKVISLTFWKGSEGMIEEAFDEMTEDYGIEYGVDYVNMGYREGYVLVILMAGEDFQTAFVDDYNSDPVAEMMALDGIESLSDIDYVVDITSGSSVEMWIAYGSMRYEFDMGAAISSDLMDSYDYMNYYISGLLTGLMIGEEGLDDYEALRTAASDT